MLTLHQAAADEEEEKRRRDTVDRMNLLDKWSNPETNPRYRDPYAAHLDADAMRALLS
jgi:hypothetical protein